MKPSHPRYDSAPESWSECTRCDGTGEICGSCRRSEEDCHCDFPDDLEECDDCDALGRIYG